MIARHPAGPGTVADHLVQRISGHLDDGWRDETDETTWRAQDESDHCGSARWVIVATGQLAVRDAYGSRPGPMVLASGRGIEVRFQLPFVVDGGDIDDVLETLTRIGAIPSPEEGR